MVNHACNLRVLSPHDTTSPPRCSLGVVEIRGDLDVFTCPALRQAVHQGVQQGCHGLVFELSSARFVDSTGLAVLLQMHLRYQRHGGRTALVCATSAVLAMLERGRLPQVMPLFGTQEEALQALAGPCDHPWEVRPAAAGGERTADG